MRSKTTNRTGLIVRGLIGSAALCAALTFSAAPSLAAPAPRSYVSQITGFTRPEAVTVGANDETWISDVENGVISKYSAYPALAKVGTQKGSGVWGGAQQVRSLVASTANGFLYAFVDSEPGAVCGDTPLTIFDNFGDLFLKEVPTNSPCEEWLAIDNNPQTDGYGQYYTYASKFQASSYIEQFDGYGNPVDFTGSAGYITGNKITGTPKGTFSAEAASGYSGVAVDPTNGNIWVINKGNLQTPEIDEFDSTGVFIKRITEKNSGMPETITPAGPTVFGRGALAGLVVDPTNGDVLVSDSGALAVDEFSPDGKYVGQLTGADTPAGSFAHECVNPNGIPFCRDWVLGVAVDSRGYVYVTDSHNHVVDIFSPRPTQPTITYEPDTNPTATSGRVNATVDPNGGGSITECKFEYGAELGGYKLGSPACSPDPSGSNFSVPTEVHADLTGLTSETTYHYRVVVSNVNGTRVGPDQTFTPHKVLGLRADPATNVTATGATLNGSFVGNGAHTHYWFEYGTSTSYGSKAPLPVPPGGDAGSPTGLGRTTEALPLSGLKPVTSYHYRIVAENGSTSQSEDRSFRTAPLKPQAKEWVTDVHSNQVDLDTRINPGGSDTTYNFEYGTEECSNIPDPCITAFNDTHIGSGLADDTASRHLTGLEGATTYYYRVIATNSAGTSHAERTFSTYPFTAEIKDPCPNGLARQQTGAALLLDCRGYELVSSSHAGGYDVESNLVPGQKPFDGYPQAENPLRVLYGVHNGAIPGVSGNPTNRGVDPYVATRGAEGWSTSYVGIPANDPNTTTPFSSTLLEADSALDTFAFGGPEICSPCFEHNSQGIPLHLPDGNLVQGMQGSNPQQPSGGDDGLVKKHFSGDGSHFVFSSTLPFESGGNEETGDVSIYDRNLKTNQTQVVSTDESAAPLTCLQGVGQCHAPGDTAGLSELDISRDGSRIVIGQKMSTDADGNNYYHLYMHIGVSFSSVDLTPGASAGAIFDGMTEDGSKVFFTTKDHLLGSEDTDASADIYEAAISGAGTVTLRLITTKGGTASNDDSCNPPGSPTSWNAASGEGKCNAVAFAGGAGLASGNGTFYFVSPELLDSAAEAEGEAGQPNLYVVKPASNPEFVATIDTSATKPPPLPPGHQVLKSNFLSGLARPESLAVEQNSGDVYVAEAETGAVSRWKPNGAPDNFSTLGSNRITGQELGGYGEGQIAVDSSNGPFRGAVYVTTNGGGGVNVYASNGEKLGALTFSGEGCGVAVDQSNGDVYVGIYSSEVRRFRPISAAKPVTNASYEPVTGIESPNNLCNLDASAEGHVYTWPYSGGSIEQFESSAFTAGFPSPTGKAIGTGASAQSDPHNGDLYVDEGSEITRYDSAGGEIEKFGSGALSESHGIGVNGTTEHVYATSGGSVVEFAYPPPYEPIDNPAVVHGVRQAGTHVYSDFQVTPSGNYAAFTTRQPLDATFLNEGHSEVYRYDTSSQALDCVSCPPTNALATGDASLASNGLSLTDDGRVFFDTNEPIVLRDGDNRKDVYEWETLGSGPDPGKCNVENPNLFPGGICLSLISTGTSQFDSSLLSASADGTDVFFFTHDTLVHGDENGPVTKLYDARTDGGFFDVPPPAKCAASDECHGPGTKEAEPAKIRTVAGTTGNPENKSCKKGFVKRQGKCVRKKHRRRHHRRSHR